MKEFLSLTAVCHFLSRCAPFFRQFVLETTLYVVMAEQLPRECVPLSHGNEGEDAKSGDLQDLRVDVWQEGSDTDVSEDGVDSDEDDAMADVDRKFRMLDESEVWQAPEGPLYDDSGAGPCNLPPGHMNFVAGEMFLLLWPLELWQLIVTHTNLYYAQRQADANLKIDESVLTTVFEVTTWVGLLMKMMSAWTGSQDDYFQDGSQLDVREYMTRRRFYWIKKHLHFADQRGYKRRGEEGHDPLYYLRNLIDSLNVTFRKYWKLHRYVSLDEMMIAFKGHNPLHCYIPRKPTPNGSKLHAVCDAVKYYCVSIMFDGKSGMSVPDVIEALTTGVLLPGQTMITDRFYTTKGVVELCLRMGVSLIGSTKTQCFLAKKVLPRWSKNDSVIPRGSYRVAVNSDGTVANIIWKDKGIVRLTVTGGASIRTYLWRRQKGRKPFLVKAPWIAKLFDMYFHGVDRNDQLRGRGYGLATTFRAKKYTVKMFMGLIDITMSNAWILWRTLHPKQVTQHRKFYKDVFEYLLQWDPLQEEEPGIAPPSECDHVHVLERLGVTPTGNPRQGNCPMCGTKSTPRKRSSWGCFDCGVALHCGKCNNEWHMLTPRTQRRKRPRRNLRRERSKPLEFPSSDDEAAQPL